MDFSILFGYVFMILFILWSFLVGIISYVFMPLIVTGIIYLCLGKKMKAKLKKKIVIWSFVLLLIIEGIIFYSLKDYIISG